MTLLIVIDDIFAIGRDRRVPLVVVVLLARDIQPAVEAAKAEKGDPLTNTVKANARLMAEKIGKEAELGGHKAEVRIVSGYYDLDTGVVEWLDEKAEK